VADLSSFSGTVPLSGGEEWAVQVDTRNLTLDPDPVISPAAMLSGDAANALVASPAWVQEELARTLAALPAEYADRLGAVILASDADWVDEVAWSIAATDTPILTWILDGGSEWLFMDNAAAIYDLEGVLPYADLVELGDGHTTLEVVGENGTTTLDPELYYNLVVYPRAYIDLPAPNGDEFWRSFFLVDDSYGETLIDAVQGAETLADAALAAGNWIQSFMTFGYNSNDTWPLDVYWAQYGSCGEYSILTTAVARTALIPTVSVSARADDHEWNEFWDGRWIMWDNSLGEIGSNPHYPYIDWPDIYDDDSYDTGVLGEVADVFRFFSDESAELSDLYTSLVPIQVTVTDAAGAPVEGTRVQVLTRESGDLMCTWASTNRDGVASVQVGDGQFVTFLADNPLLGTVLDDWVRTDVCKQPCQAALAFSETIPRRAADAGVPPSGNIHLLLDFTVTGSETRVSDPVTEGYELGETYGVPADGGVVDVFLVDSANVAAWENGEPFGAWSVTTSAASGSLDLALPAGDTWTLVVSDEPWPTVRRTVDVDVHVVREK
jgi:hypothetical protein